MEPNHEIIKTRKKEDLKESAIKKAFAVSRRNLNKIVAFYIERNCLLCYSSPRFASEIKR